MAFKKCKPGESDAFGTLWIDGQQHDIVEPDGVDLRVLHKKLTDKGGGHYGVDKSESALLKVTIRKRPDIERREYEDIRCSIVQYQTRTELYTLRDAFFVVDSQSPGDGEKIEGSFHPGPGFDISSIPV